MTTSYACCPYSVWQETHTTQVSQPQPTCEHHESSKSQSILGKRATRRQHRGLVETRLIFTHHEKSEKNENMVRKLSIKIPASPIVPRSADTAQNRVSRLRAMFDDTRYRPLSDNKHREHTAEVENEPTSAYEDDEDDEDTRDNAETPIANLPRAPEYAELALINPYHGECETGRSTTAEGSMVDAEKLRLSKVSRAVPVALRIEVPNFHRRETEEEIMLRLSREFETAQQRIEAAEAHALQELKGLYTPR